MAKNEEIISIRVPAGLKQEIAALTGVNFSKYCRTLLISALNIERKKASKGQVPNATATQPEESKP